jgi:ankyrin repeat protein
MDKIFRALEEGDESFVIDVLDPQPFHKYAFIRNKNGETLFHVSIRRNRSAIIHFLTNQCIAKNGNSGALVNEKILHPSPTSILHFICTKGDLARAQFLLDCGADVNYRDSFGAPLHHVLNSKLDSGIKIKFLYLLFEYGYSLQSTNKYGQSLLFYGYEPSNYEIIKILLTRFKPYININYVDTAGNSALNYNIISYNKTPDHYELITLLIKNGADIFLANKRGIYAMSAAIQGDHADLCDLIHQVSLKKVTQQSELEMAAYELSLES